MSEEPIEKKELLEEGAPNTSISRNKVNFGRGCPLFRSSPSKTPVLRYHPLLSTFWGGRYNYHICKRPCGRTGELVVD